MQQRLFLKVLFSLRRLSDADEWLNQCKVIQPHALRDAKRVAASWHEWLYASAFPLRADCYTAAQVALQQIIERVAQWKVSAPDQFDQLTDSGIPGTWVRCNYSLHLLKTLMEAPANHTTLFDFGASDDVVRPLWQSLFPSVEFELSSQQTMPPAKRWKLLTGTNNRHKQLQLLLSAAARATASARLNDALFDPMQVFVQWTPSVFQSSIPTGIFATNAPDRQPDTKQIRSLPLPRPMHLSTADSHRLIALMRSVLAVLHRETDPVTYADAASLEAYDLGRGFQLVLVGMQPERRLSLEAYIGYMGFKNGIPVAYGGGWLWADQCKIGLNILPAFRGGESAWIFAQILRVYQQRFAVAQFRVSPYQYGAGNPDGLRSGAYWMYYKLGFRSADEGLRLLAEQEWEKISRQKGYRTDLNTLKKFTRAALVLVPGKGSIVSSTASFLSASISQWIGLTAQGNRQLAIRRWHNQTGISLNELNAGQRENLILLSGWLTDNQYPDQLRSKFLQWQKERLLLNELKAARRLALLRRIWLHWPIGEIPASGYIGGEKST